MYSCVMNEHLSHLSKLICDFLLAHGGMSNGYETYAKGDICGNGSGSVEVLTPHNMEEMTVGAVKQRNRELSAALNGYCRKNELKDAKFRVRAEHIEWGCYKVFVEHTESYRAW